MGQAEQAWKLLSLFLFTLLGLLALLSCWYTIQQQYPATVVMKYSFLEYRFHWVVFHGTYSLTTVAWFINNDVTIVWAQIPSSHCQLHWLFSPPRLKRHLRGWQGGRLYTRQNIHSFDFVRPQWPCNPPWDWQNTECQHSATSSNCQGLFSFQSLCFILDKYKTEHHPVDLKGLCPNNQTWWVNANTTHTSS